MVPSYLFLIELPPEHGGGLPAAHVHKNANGNRTGHGNTCNVDEGATITTTNNRIVQMMVVVMITTMMVAMELMITIRMSTNNQCQR